MADQIGQIHKKNIAKNNSLISVHANFVFVHVSLQKVHIIKIAIGNLLSFENKSVVHYFFITSNNFFSLID